MRTKPIGRQKPRPQPPPIEGVRPRPRQPTLEEILEAQRVLQAVQDQSHDGEMEIGDGGFNGTHLTMLDAGRGPLQIRPAGDFAWNGKHPDGSPRPMVTELAGKWKAEEQACYVCGADAYNVCVACACWLCPIHSPNAMRGPCAKCGLAAVWPYDGMPKGTFRATSRRSY